MAASYHRRAALTREGRLADLFTRISTEQQSAAETVRRLAANVIADDDGPLRDDATLFLLEYHGRAGTRRDGPDRSATVAGWSQPGRDPRSRQVVRVGTHLTRRRSRCRCHPPSR